MLRGALAASALAVFVLAAGEITITDVYQIRTFAEEIYTGFALGDSLADVPLRTLPGMLLLGSLALAALLACAQVSRQFTMAGGARRWRADVRGWRATIWLLLVAWLALMVAVPLGNLLYQAGMQVTAVGPLRQRHWSGAKALGMLAASPMRFAQEYAWSFALAQLTSISLLLVVVPLAWASRRWIAARMVAWAGVLVGLTLPGPLLALLLGRLLNQPSSDWLFYLYDRTLVLPWMALSVRLFPFAYVLVELVVHRLPQRLLDLATTESARISQLLRHAVWPELAPVVGWLWLVLVALSVADLSATVLAVPPGVTTVSIRIFNLVHYGVADQLAGLCLGTVMLFGGLAALVLGLRPAKFGAEQRRL
jgi:iron(III) transport system permease protein